MNRRAFFVTAVSWGENKPRYESAPPVSMNPWYTRTLLDGYDDDGWCVYLMESGNHYKIGITTNIKERLAALNHASGSPVTLVALRRGGREIEAQLHDVLAGCRSQGEWFTKCDVVRDAFYALATTEIVEPEPERACLPLFDDEAVA